MKKFVWLILILLGLLVSCQTNTSAVTLLDGENIIILNTSQRAPAAWLEEAGLTLDSEDHLLYLGEAVDLNAPFPGACPCTLVVRRAVTVTLVTPAGRQTLRSSAQTVGQALVEAGFELYAADRLDPPAGAPLDGGLDAIVYQPSREYIVRADGREVRLRSAAATVGQALAEGGMPLVGLDQAAPSEDEPLPPDGEIRIIRVTESVDLLQKLIPYQTRQELSAELELDQQLLLEAGEPGLAVARVRTRYEDGNVVWQQPEEESLIRPPRDRVVGYGTRVVMKTANVDGEVITYWRALPFYATSYHPSETGSEITASGKRITGKGLAAVDNRYIPFGTRLYVPGYGYAEAADNGGFSGRWIDLAYTDAEYVPWHRWVTVYFLWPPPDFIAYVIPPPYSTAYGFSPSPP